MKKSAAYFLVQVLVPVAIAFAVTGCHSGKNQSACCSSTATATPTATVSTPAAVPAAAVNPPTTQAAVRIKAGAAAPFTDSAGNVWAADQGFNGGDTVERPDLSITNTAEPGIYRSEHYGMDSFSCPLANGKYLVKLHFCETYDGIEGPGQRVFSFNVAGHDYKDFDVWVKAGGPLKAYVESVPVEITNGKLLITFTAGVENPQINGIEVIPQS